MCLAPHDRRSGSNAGKKHDKHRISKGEKQAKQNNVSTGVFSCFSLSGEDAEAHHRSSFSPKRRKQVRGVRRIGACLRCRLLKRSCSGDDPCTTCVAAATAATGSHALKWMDCIRPCFKTMNIFDNRTEVQSNWAMQNLLSDDVYLDFDIPFKLDVEAASTHLGRWLSDDYTPSTFSVVGVFSRSTITSLLDRTFDPSLGKDLRVFVHLTTHLYTTRMASGYLQYANEEVRAVRDAVGYKLLAAIDPLLRPQELEASRNKLERLRSLFLLILGITVGMRYTCFDAADECDTTQGPAETRQQALIRLLFHYLIYIGRTASLLDDSCDGNTLKLKWKSLWSKPAAFTWNLPQGLITPYKMDPPDEGIGSSIDEETASDKNARPIDTSSVSTEDCMDFIANTDMLKCLGCKTFWASLDDGGFCQGCRSLQPLTDHDLTLDENQSESMNSNAVAPFHPGEYVQSPLVASSGETPYGSNSEFPVLSLSKHVHSPNILSLVQDEQSRDFGSFPETYSSHQGPRLFEHREEWQTATLPYSSQSAETSNGISIYSQGHMFNSESSKQRSTQMVQTSRKQHVRLIRQQASCWRCVTAADRTSNITNSPTRIVCRSCLKAFNAPSQQKDFEVTLKRAEHVDRLATDQVDLYRCGHQVQSKTPVAFTCSVCQSGPHWYAYSVSRIRHKQTTESQANVPPPFAATIEPQTSKCDDLLQDLEVQYLSQAMSSQWTEPTAVGSSHNIHESLTPDLDTQYQLNTSEPIQEIPSPSSLCTHIPRRSGDLSLQLHTIHPQDAVPSSSCPYIQEHWRIPAEGQYQLPTASQDEGGTEPHYFITAEGDRVPLLPLPSQFASQCGREEALQWREERYGWSRTERLLI